MSDPRFDPQLAARTLIDQRLNKARNDMLAPSLGVNSLARAYDVQDVIVSEMKRGGRQVAGYKVGLTTKRMQEMCGLDQPIGGVVFADVLADSPARAALADYGRLGLEFEICIRLGEPVGAAEQSYDRNSISRFVSDIGPAFELIDDRNADYAALDIHSLVADNSWNAGVVLGPMAPYSGDMAELKGILYLNDEQIDEGMGADVLGHPLESLAWLANNLISRGAMLNAGDLVMTGSLIPTRFPQIGETYRFDMGGLGQVELGIDP